MKKNTEYIEDFIDDYYDLSIATALINHLCDKPADAVKEVCGSDLTRGPYILTYGKKIGGLSPLPPPLLFVDLTPIHKRAFAEVVPAYLSQVKSPDFSDGAKIDTFRLKLLNLALIAADSLQPISAAAAGIIHQVK